MQRSAGTERLTGNGDLCYLSFGLSIDFVAKGKAELTRVNSIFFFKLNGLLDSLARKQGD